MSLESIVNEMDKNSVKYFTKIVSGWNHGGDDRPKKG